MFNHHVLAIPILAVPTLNARSKTEPSIASVRQITSAIRTARVDQSVYSTRIALAIRAVSVIVVSILARELVVSTPTVEWPTTSPSAAAKNPTPEIPTDLAVPFPQNVRFLSLTTNY